MIAAFFAFNVTKSEFTVSGGPFTKSEFTVSGGSLKEYRIHCFRQTMVTKKGFTTSSVPDPMSVIHSPPFSTAGA